MYQVEWDKATGGILLADKQENRVNVEVRPVFFEELDLLGFNEHWEYPRVNEPLLWAVGGRKYYYCGELVAEAKGGGLFTRPQLILHKHHLSLEPVDIHSMVEKNDNLLQGLIQKSLKFIWQTYSKLRDDVDITAVAFSGGKDSIVTLDLVQRVLAPDQFVVVFGDTGMEVSDTYQAVEDAKGKWPHLGFYTAKSTKDALTTWKEMGPPSRIHRWCCSVHKSVPTLLLLRKLAGKAAVNALIFDGVRHAESASRSSYESITYGGKHKMQTNASPILSWSAGEVYLYLFSRQLFLNRAYRYGVTRVGCSVCPMAASWWDIISWKVFNKDMAPFINELRHYANCIGVKASQVDDYLENGGWKGRAGGRYLPEGGNRVIEQIDGEKVVFLIRQATDTWLEWAKALGTVVRTGTGQGYIIKEGFEYRYLIRSAQSGTIVEVHGLTRANQATYSAFRSIATKSAYCCRCQSCQVECPTGALTVYPNVSIDSSCIRCGRCLNFHGETCLTAKSLRTSSGGVSMDGSTKKLSTYNHFGMEKEWLAKFFQSPKSWVANNSLGSRQFDAMVGWLKHAEIVTGSKSSLAITALGESLSGRGADNPITWAVIWTNLIRNSPTVAWYAKKVPWGAVMTKTDLVAHLGNSFSQSESTRSNAITALVGLLTKTPLGTELGLGEDTKPGKRVARPIYKKGWLRPNPRAVLYSLYRYAELTKRYELTIHELYDDAQEGPYVAFGVEKTILIGILQGLSTRGDGLIRINIVRDLDNIFLDRTCSAIEVLNYD